MLCTYNDLIAYATPAHAKVHLAPFLYVNNLFASLQHSLPNMRAIIRSADVQFPGKTAIGEKSLIDTTTNQKKDAMDFTATETVLVLADGIDTMEMKQT